MAAHCSGALHLVHSSAAKGYVLRTLSAMCSVNFLACSRLPSASGPRRNVGRFRRLRNRHRSCAVAAVPRARSNGAQGQRQLPSRERGRLETRKISFRLTEMNLSDLRKVPVPLTSLSKQKQIVSYLRKLGSKAEPPAGRNRRGTGRAPASGPFECVFGGTVKICRGSEDYYSLSVLNLDRPVSAL